MKSLLKITLFSILAVVFFAAFALAQDKPKDTVIITVGFAADELHDLVNTDYRPGITATLNAKIVGSKTRLGGKFRFDKLEEVKTYTFGPELSHKLGFVEPYAHFLVGYQTVDGFEGKEIVRTVGAGVRLNFGHVVLNPFQFDQTRSGGFLSPGRNQFSASIGVRF